MPGPGVLTQQLLPQLLSALDLSPSHVCKEHRERALPALRSGGAAVHRLGHFCVITSPNTAALRTVGASPSSLGRWVLRAQLTPSCKQEPPTKQAGVATGGSGCNGNLFHSRVPSVSAQSGIVSWGTLSGLPWHFPCCSQKVNRDACPNHPTAALLAQSGPRRGGHSCEEALSSSHSHVGLSCPPHLLCGPKVAGISQPLTHRSQALHMMDSLSSRQEPSPASPLPVPAASPPQVVTAPAS